MLDIVIELMCSRPNAQRLVPVAEKAAHLTLESQGRTHASLGIALADDDYVRDLNRRYRQKDATTDVLSFPLWEEGDSLEVPLGDIVISVMAAERQAEERGHHLEIEVIYLVSHGVLHLLGWCDDSTDEEERMWEIQKQIASDYRRRR